MARTPQSFAKRQRERLKQQKRMEKLERRLIRNEEKKLAKMEQDGEISPDHERYSEDEDEESTGSEFEV